jgi:hypothetical protein
MTLGATRAFCGGASEFGVSFPLLARSRKSLRARRTTVPDGAHTLPALTWHSETIA